MDLISILSKIVLQAPPTPSIEERVIPTMIFAAIVALALLGYGAMKKNKGALVAGVILVIGVAYAYVRFLTPYLPAAATAGMNTSLFEVGAYKFTYGTLGAIIALIVIIAVLAWYRKNMKRSR
jgi:hypothetical protein